MGRVSPDGTVERLLPSGLAIHAVSTLDIDFLYREIFEQEIYVQHGISIAEGSTVMDCGANIGLFSIYAAKAAGSSVSFLLTSWEVSESFSDFQHCFSLEKHSPHVSNRIPGSCWHAQYALCSWLHQPSCRLSECTSHLEQGRVLSIEPLDHIYSALKGNAASHLQHRQSEGEHVSMGLHAHPVHDM